jgi:hypothetical protein
MFWKRLSHKNKVFSSGGGTYIIVRLKKRTGNHKTTLDEKDSWNLGTMNNSNNIWVSALHSELKKESIND